MSKKSPDKWFTISLEGIDKAGKGLILNYLKHIGKYKYVILDRGLVSNIVFSEIYGRDYQYDREQYKNVVFVYLTVDVEDWLVRCKMSNEPTIDFRLNQLLFKRAIDEFKQDGFKVLEYNTTKMTAYQIAKNIIDQVEELNSFC